MADCIILEQRSNLRRRECLKKLSTTADCDTCRIPHSDVIVYCYVLFTLNDLSATKSDPHVGPTKILSVPTQETSADR